VAQAQLPNATSFIMPRDRDRETAQAAAIDDFELTAKENEAGTKYNMSRVELVEACRLFRTRLETNPGDNDVDGDRSNWALAFEDVDLLLRQLRIYMSMKTLWALFAEIDENVNGKVEAAEYVAMVSKLRGRSPMSPQFHLRSLPRTVRDSYEQVYNMVVDEKPCRLDGEPHEKMMDRDDLISSSKKLHIHVNTSSEVFRQAIDDLNITDNKYSLNDFLLFEAKLRKPKPEIDVALLSLTDEEKQRMAIFFADWRSKSQSNGNAAELRLALNQLGMNISAEQCRNRLASLDLDGTRPIQLNEFLYILVNLGIGSCTDERLILNPGATYEGAFKKGMGLQEIWELGYDDLSQIKRAGWSVHNVASAGFAEAWQLRQVGYTAGELRKAGWSATQLKLAGFSLEELRNAGFCSEALRECCSSLGRHRAQKAQEGPGLVLRPATNADRPQKGNNGDVGEQRWWGTPRIQAMLQPDQSNETIMSLMSH